MTTEEEKQYISLQDNQNIPLFLQFHVHMGLLSQHVKDRDHKVTMKSYNIFDHSS